LWSMDLSSDALAWTPRSYVWTAPGLGANSLIQNAAFAFDPVRSRLIAFGGYWTPLQGPCYSCVQELNSVYSLTLSDTPTWTQENVGPGQSRPTARR
jgi:hypothetical protein